ncbi:MAG: hypothetical protein IT336_10470, partial [Thermomicrobiales bacterium]|nr:hypothetical protein [Thermomicrobiales bacterium]
MLSLNVVRDPHWSAGVAGFGALFLVVPLVASRSTTILIADAVFIVVTAVATLLCARVGAARGAARPTWLSAAAGCAFWLAAQVFMVPEHLGLTDNDLLELGADVTSMLVVPALVTGLMLLAHSGQSRRVRREMVLDATLAIIATTAVGYEAVAGPIRQGAGNDRMLLGATIAWQAFALAGFFALTAGLIWRAGSLARPVARPLLGGFITLIGGVVCYIVGVIVSDYHPGSPIDAPFLAGFLLLIVAASRAHRVPDLQPAPLGQDYLRWRTGLVISSILAVGGMATYAASAPGRDPQIAALLVVATVVLVARVAIGASDHLR